VTKQVNHTKNTTMKKKWMKKYRFGEVILTHTLTNKLKIKKLGEEMLTKQIYWWA